jgi:hypothetical protein
MPNALAYLALGVSPLLVFALYRSLRVELALIWSILLGYLFLPESPAVFDFPLMPPLNKHNMPALAAFIATLLVYPGKGPLLPESNVGKVLVFTFIFSPLLTVVTNMEPVFYGRVGLPALGLKDALALVLLQFMIIMPFLLARRHLNSGDALRDLMKALMIAGLVYSLLMLIEIRLSPQLNLWTYGFFQHYFGQSVRFGGYRPVVFLYHGLWVAFFAMTAALATLALWRVKLREFESSIRYFLAALYLLVVLVLSKSLGALIFAAFAVPLILLTKPRMQMRVAVLLAVLALGYPLMKGANLVPEDFLISRAAAISEDRAGSIQFRFDNERTLLDRASLKPVFGWGSWGRNHELDPETGRLLTVTDGRWIVTIGTFGWVGFLAEFGLLLLPILQSARQVKRLTPLDYSGLVGAATLLLAINAVDMIPNATLTPITWLFAGTLTGYAERLKQRSPTDAHLLSKLEWKPVIS